MPNTRDSSSPEPIRYFDVEADGIEIGRFPLPPLPSQEEEDEETTRQITERPVLWGDASRNLFWVEETESGDQVPMIWLPRTEDEANTVYALFSLASRFCSSDDEDDDDESGETAGPIPNRIRRFVSVASVPPVLRSLVASGAELTETSGPIGSVGQAESETFPNAEEAKEALERRALALLGEGYVEIVPLETRILDKLPPSRVPGDPTYWSTTEAWEAVRDLLIPLSPSLAGFVPPEMTKEIDALETQLGFRLPPSYKAFLRVFGPGGVRSNFFSIAAPSGPWNPNADEMTRTVRKSIDYLGYDFVTEEHARLEPISRMIFFCKDFGGNQFGWDPDAPRDSEAGEYAVLEWPRGWDYVEEAAASFPEFFLDVLLRDVKRRFGRQADPTFAPDSPVT